MSKKKTRRIQKNNEHIKNEKKSSEKAGYKHDNQDNKKKNNRYLLI